MVYGDIGTSPLYALKECFATEYGVTPSPENVIGVLSLIFWSLNFVVSLKYLTFIMRADNRGEGGIMALLALLHPRQDSSGRRRLLIGLGLFGAALLYGDGVITPAISVLGAVEGISVAVPGLGGMVVPAIAALILVGLFLVQRGGTARIGAVFGRVMIVWFASIAALGIRGILRHPDVLRAVNPWHAIDFLGRDGPRGFLILGAVVLVVTGAEALYADMGHFGKRPIRLAWVTVVLPALVLNYFGQGAMLIANPATARNPFYGLVPPWALFPMVVIATAAAIVASQALISGVFSLTRQAIQLGYSPRVTIQHTSQTEIGQIYLPGVNRTLGLLSVMLVLAFRTTGNLASAYGIAVTGTMTITTILFCVVARDLWHWPLWRVVAIGGVFLVVDLCFLGANLVKIAKGGWFPLLVALAVYVLMTTWKRGRMLVTGILRENSLPISLFLEDIARRKPARVPGTAVFMTSDPSGAPVVLLHHLKHNKVLHERVLLMSIEGRGDSPGAAGGSRGGDGAGGGLLPGRRTLWLHGITRRAGFPRHVGSPWAQRKADGDQLLSRAGDPAAQRQVETGPLAQEDLHLDGAECADGDGILQPAGESGGGAGGPNTILAGSWGSGSYELGFLPTPPTPSSSSSPLYPRTSPSND